MNLPIPMYWCLNGNFGDVLNRYLVWKITGRTPVYVDISQSQRKFVAIGSILNWCDGNCIVWGAGLGNRNDSVNPNVKILSVRGPLTRQRVLEENVRCPDVFGDPALLLPKFFTPIAKNKYALGIIPHYVNQLEVFNSPLAQSNDVKIIDVFDSVEKILDEICSCNYILSSSLHGLVVADVYGIPNHRFYGQIPLDGDGMKFDDYYASVRVHPNAPINYCELANMDVFNVIKNIEKKPIDMQFINLWNVCPFKN